MLKTLETALDVASDRARTLAENLANVNTPGYVRRDIPFHSVMRATLREGDDGEGEADPPVRTARADGNQVDLEREMAAISENALIYQTVAQITAARLSAVKYAIAEGRGR